MFARQFRLPPRIKLHQKTFISSPFFALNFGENTLQTNRYGFIVSKQIDKRSVIRNRLKRRFRACIEKLHMDLSQGHDMLFILRKEALGKTSLELHKDVINAFSRRKLLAKV